MISAAATGFITAFSLILAIGAQNVFVLRQGLLRAHVFWLCLFCAVSDAVLICAGVFGFGAVVKIYPAFPAMMAWGGFGFLIVYGASRFWAAYRGNYAMVLDGKSAGLWVTLATGFAFTWLNPHVYLDTLGLIGAISTQFTELPAKLAFALGASASSLVFFFSLGFGARLLGPIMQSAKAWRILDVLIGVVLWLLALGLLMSAV